MIPGDGGELHGVRAGVPDGCRVPALPNMSSGILRRALACERLAAPLDMAHKFAAMALSKMAARSTMMRVFANEAFGWGPGMNRVGIAELRS
jgi:hypothetical protein